MHCVEYHSDLKHVMKGHDLLPGTSIFTFITFISGHKQAIMSYTCHNLVFYFFLSTKEHFRHVTYG